MVGPIPANAQWVNNSKCASKLDKPTNAVDHATTCIEVAKYIHTTTIENKGTIVVTNVMGAFKMTRFDKLRTHTTANSDANMSQQDDVGDGNRDPPLPLPLPPCCCCCC